ncbi:MAG: divalent-cation tolerance protein CutA [Crenarchaeota archaeon]|nr:divalent-cation tolerance protein CutA [Thermoproteota archaeon]
MAKSLGTYVVVLVTVPDVETGLKIARELVSSRLVACVNIVKDVKSIFLWEGKVDEASEALLIMKTRLDKMDDVVRKVKELHPYQVPEIIAVPIVYGLESYLKWIDEVVQH